MTIPFHTFSYLGLVIPFHTFSYLSIPFDTFPYLFIPFHTFSDCTKCGLKRYGGTLAAGSQLVQIWQSPWVLPDYTVFRPTTLWAEIEVDCELEWQAFGPRQAFEQWNSHSKPLANGMTKGLEFTLAGSGLHLVTHVQAILDIRP